MGIFKLLSNGMSGANKKFKVVVYLWLSNLLFALMAVLPVYFYLSRNVSRSLLGDSLRRGMDYNWLIDTAYRLSDTGSVIMAWFLVPAVFYLLFHIFLNGGILGRLNAVDQPVTLQGFFSDCGAWFGPFFRLFLLSIPIYAVMLGLVFGLISAFLGFFVDGAGTAWPAIITGNLRILAFLLVFSIVNMLFDYAKIHLVKSGGRKVLKAFWQTVKFLFKRFFKAWALYLLIGILNVLLLLVYLEVSNILPGGSNLFLIFIVFLWQQAYAVGRTWFKVTFFSAQMGLYSHHEPVPAVVEAAGVEKQPEHDETEPPTLEAATDEV